MMNDQTPESPSDLIILTLLRDIRKNTFILFFPKKHIIPANVPENIQNFRKALYVIHLY